MRIKFEIRAYQLEDFSDGRVVANDIETIMDARMAAADDNAKRFDQWKEDKERDRVDVDPFQPHLYCVSEIAGIAEANVSSSFNELCQSVEHWSNVRLEEFIEAPRCSSEEVI